MPVPAMLSWVAWTKRALSATSPKFQPSPYRKIALAVDAVPAQGEASSARRTASMVAFGLVAHQVEAEAVDLVLASPR